MYKQYLPSKTFFIVVCSFVVFIGVIYGFGVWRKNVRVEQEKLALAKINQMAISNSNTDSDGDGLMDWEEARLGTNAKKADTDGDGTNDGTEVILGRDPLVPAPNDFVNYVSMKTSTSTPLISSQAELTETEKMMRTMLTVAMRDDQSDPNFPNVVAKNIMADFDKKVATLPANFTIKNISTVTETETSLKKYGNDLGGILKKYETQTAEQNKLLYDVAVALKTADLTTFSNVPAMIKARNDQVSSLVKIKVPEDMAPFHLSLLNAMSDITVAIDNISKTVSDPTRGLIGMQQYKGIATKLNASLEAIKNHFDNSGIWFTSSENGDFLYHPIKTSTN